MSEYENEIDATKLANEFIAVITERQPTTRCVKRAVQKLNEVLEFATIRGIPQVKPDETT